MQIKPTTTHTVVVADCENCPIECNPVKVRTNKSARLIIVNDEPTRDEGEEGKFGIGRAGNLLNKILDFWDIDRELDIHTTAAILCRPGRKLTPAEQRQAVKCCRKRLEVELEELEGKHVVAFGHMAHLALTGKGKIKPWVGGPTKGAAWKPKRKTDPHPGELADFSAYSVVPTWSPSKCLNLPAETPYTQIHVGRAWGLATGALKEWQWPKFHLWPDEEAYQALCRIAERGRVVAIDIETQGTDPRKSPIMCAGFSDGIDTVSIPWERYNSGKYGQVKGLRDYDEEGRRCYNGALRILKGCRLVAHNGAHDIAGFRDQYGIDISDGKYVFDTLLAHAVVAPRVSHTLGYVASGELPAPAWKAIFGDETGVKGLAKFVKRPEEVLRNYNAQDAYMTYLCMEKLQEHLDHTHLGNEQMALMMDKARCAMKMTSHGMAINYKAFPRHRENFTKLREKARKDYEALAWKDINPNSPKDNAKLFFDILGVPPVKWSENGSPSLDEKALTAYSANPSETVRACASTLLRYRRWSKLLSTYITGMEIDNGRVHADWKVHGTRTGRWSSSPNLQNIPKSKGDRPGLRDIFMASPGMELVEADYSQLELRIISILANDPILLDGYAKGRDIHQENANVLFKREKASPGERKMAKVFVFASNYGAKPREIWERMVVNFPTLSLAVVEMIHERWFDVHKELYQWQQRTYQEAKRLRYVECPISGRRQYYPDGKVDFNEVLNFPIQGTGADIIDPALVRLSSQIDWKTEAIVSQVHDALIGEAHAWLPLAKKMKKEMERPVKIRGVSYTFPVDIQVGSDWGNMKEMEL